MSFTLGTSAGAGTVTIAAGGTAVAGVGTNFVAGNIGAILVVGAQWGVITAVASTTSATLDRAFATAVTASAYTLSANYPIITQSGTDTSLSAFNTLAGVSNLSLGDARVYLPASAMLDITGTLTIPALTEKLVFDNQADTAVGGTQRDHDIQVSGTLNIDLSSVVNGTTIYAPDFVYFSRRPAPSGGGGEHQLNATGSSFYVTPTGTVNLTGGTYVTQFNFACDTGGRLNVTGSHLKGRGDRFWMKAGSITTFTNCTIEGFNIFFNTFPTSISGVTFKDCGSIYKAIGFDGGFDSAPSVVLSPQWLATANPIITILGGAWLRVKNSTGGSSLGVLNIAATPWASGIADFHQDVSFAVKDLAGAAVVGFKYYAAESNDGNRRNVQQYTGIGPFFNNTDIRTMLFTTAGGGVSNTIEMRLQAGVTTLTPTATPGSGGLVTTNYGQTSSDEYDFFGIGYKYALSKNRIQCRANGALSIATVALPDLSITETTKATVDAYTAIGTPQKFYDRAKSYLYDNFAGETATLVTRVGSKIFLGAYNLVVDATAGSVFALSGGTITIKETIFVGDVETTGTVTLLNGAKIQGIVTSSAGSTDFISVTGLVGTYIGLNNNVAALVDYQAAVTGTYTYSVPAGSTGPWKLCLRRQGYAPRSVTITLGGTTHAIDGTLVKRINFDGSDAYTGTTSSLVSVAFNSPSAGQCRIDIGDGQVSAQIVYNMVCDAFVASSGICFGLDNVFQVDPIGFELYYMSSNLKLRRKLVGYTGASVQGVVSQGDSSPIDESNGYVRVFSAPNALAKQDVRDSLLLAPTIGASVIAGSTDATLAAIKAKTDNLPALPASTTNITAGTITTVTNLTNAPTAGDLTATMKASVTTAATAATPTVSDTSGTTTLLSRVTGAVLLASSYTAPNNAGIAAIKAKTDNLPAAPAAVGSEMMLAATTHTGAIIPRVTLVDTTTTNTDMRGTNGAITSLAGISTKTDIDAALTVVNNNVKLASLFIPATANIP